MATIVGILSAKIENFHEFIRLNWYPKSLKFLLFFSQSHLSAISATTDFIKVIFEFEFINAEGLKTVIQIISTLAIPVIRNFIRFLVFSKIKIYEVFVEGAMSRSTLL